MSDLESNIIENAGIFTNDFKLFVRNNAINLPSTEEIVAIYGPNGTGKTNLIKALSDIRLRTMGSRP